MPRRHNIATIANHTGAKHTTGAIPMRKLITAHTIAGNQLFFMLTTTLSSYQLFDSR